MNELHLFAGSGGGILAGQLLGHRTVCAVEWEPYAQAVLVARQNDGTFPPFPIWDDVQTFDGKPWSGVVDIVCGGFPCQDISVAGKGTGIEGKRSGMWSHMARIIGEIRPKYAFIENSPALVTRGLERVLCDLASMGFDAEWGVLGASDVGAPHKRERIWILAHANSVRKPQPKRSQQNQWGRFGNSGEILDYSNSTQRERDKRTERINEEYANPCGSSWWRSEPQLGRVANGVAHRSHRLKAIGNGQVPRVAAAAFARMIK